MANKPLVKGGAIVLMAELAIIAVILVNDYVLNVVGHNFNELNPGIRSANSL